LDGKMFVPTTYGHCTTLFRVDGKDYVYDSMPRYNVYQIPKIEDVKNFYRKYYIYLPADTSEGMDYIRKTMTENSKQW
jgi:hypothetical protein